MIFQTGRVELLVYCYLFFCTYSAAGDAQCSDINTANITDKCAFASDVNGPCAVDEGFINYIQVVYCHFPDVIPIGVILFVFWWLFLFLGLAVTADDFFCPSLTVIAKVLRMSDNIAYGVTLLAFGNGAPDIFSSIAAIGSAKSGNAGLAFGALLGAGVFVTAVVSGAVIISSPFQCMERPLLRDITFYLVGVFYVFYIMYQQKIYTLQAIGFLLLYIAYVLVVVIGRLIRKRQQSSSGRISSSNDPTGSTYPDTVVEQIDRDPDMPTTFSKHLADEAEHGNNSHTHQHGRYHQPPHIQTPSESEADERVSLLSSNSVTIKTSYGRWKEFLHVINPVSLQEWHESKWYGKVYIACKAPIQLVLTITCPVVDYDAEKDNWNRTVSALQVLVGPIFAVFATNLYSVMLGSFPLWALIAIVFFVLSVLTYWFSEDDTPPKWHPILAFLGFIIAVIWIYCIANEIVNLLQLFGVTCHISDALLGLTLLAWGNSIGDLIADTSLARKGYPRIGISACFGGPLFNLLLGVGIPFTIGCIKHGGVFYLELDLLQLILALGLTISLLSTYIIAPLVLKFYLKKWFGIYLIALYILFLVVAVLAETGVITADLSGW